MKKRKPILGRIFDQAERKGFVSYKFDRVCKVLSVNKTNDYKGMYVDERNWKKDLIVVEFIENGIVYKGIVKSIFLNIFPVNLDKGRKYRFQSNEILESIGSYRILKIENISPSKSSESLFF